MGFLDNSQNIFIDAVLTDEGRERLSKNDGSFVCVRIRFADDEIDYRNWSELTSSDSKDRKILDSPVFEAFSNEAIALRFPLISIRNSRLQYLPQFVSKPASISLKEQTDSSGGGSDITVSQEIARAQTIIPPELVDVNYSVECDNELLYINGENPVAITPFNTAKYIIPAAPGRITSANGTECKFNLRVQTLSTEVFDTLVGVSVAKPRTLTTTVRVTGQQSGLGTNLSVSIVEFAQS